MTPSQFVDAIAKLQLPSVFNPYSDICPHFDLPDAASIRRRNLHAQLEAALEFGIDAIWLGRDLGYRGGRRTGVALTDEPNLPNVGRSFGRSLSLSRATVGPPMAERTATVIWRTIHQLKVRVFTWNVFPMHPHVLNEPLTNRCHTRAERSETRPILIGLLDLLQPSRLVAIGNDAEACLFDLGLPCDKVRHPSYGGISDFEVGIAALHQQQLTATDRRQPILL